MKRDFDLIREILLVTEAKPEANNLLSAQKMNLPNWTLSEINYHLLLLTEAGYIQSADLSSDQELRFDAVRLTWEGHEFLDAARDQKRWGKIKTVMGDVGTFAFDVLKKVLADIALQSARAALNLPPA